MNMKEQVEMEWNNFYQGNNKGPYLPELISKLCRLIGVTKEDTDKDMEMGIPLHFFKVMVFI